MKSISFEVFSSFLIIIPLMSIKNLINNKGLIIKRNKYAIADKVLVQPDSPGPVPDDPLADPLLRLKHPVPPPDQCPQGAPEPVGDLPAAPDKPAGVRVRIRPPRGRLLRLQLPRVGQVQGEVGLLSV